MSVSYRCEHNFWNNSVLENSVDEPLAAFSGLTLVVMAILGNAGLATESPTRLSMARAALLCCGLGTCAYHSLSESRMKLSYTNGNLYDGVSMAIFTYNLFLLHLSQWLNRHKLFASCMCLMYLFLWVITNDWFLFTYLDQSFTDQSGNALLPIAVQYPTFIAVYLYILIRIGWEYGKREGCWYATFFLHYPMWIALAAAGTSWCVYLFGCQKYSSFAFWGHTVWHIGIGYVAIYMVLLGAEMTYMLKKAEKYNIWWPKFKDGRQDTISTAAPSELKNVTPSTQLAIALFLFRMRSSHKKHNTLVPP